MAQDYGSITFETKGLKKSSSVHQFSPVDEAQIMVSKNIDYTIVDIKESSLGPYKFYRLVLKGN